MIITMKLNPLDVHLPASQQYRYHNFLRTASFYYGIRPDDPCLATRRFKMFKNFLIAFLFSICLRTVVECFLPKGSAVFLYLGDFKIWWGE